MNYTLNLAIAMMMLSIFGDELSVYDNETQGTVTLSSPNDDCYCTITKEQYDNLFTQLGSAMDQDLSNEDKESAAFDDLLNGPHQELGVAPAPIGSTINTADLTTAETL